ncbi:ribonuclease HII [Brochothrix campestris]|uniref:Ribonuclease HII n=1 Tax=Brochothrix campestris FSL F6-1037 TaxID=1265861 RepID=W7DAA8_9LIST|nr:ribonuclease HII [Brochothrix campestris]EUJ42198.1 ribonuclease HII [Brochothrix campestris FSL F6-1037]
MSHRDSIAAIKQALQTVKEPTDSLLERLKADERKGVQLALKQWYNRFDAAQQLIAKREEMLTYERAFQVKNYQVIAGVDEVGRGPLAGPVVAAAVILPQNTQLIGIDDSKKLSFAKKQALYEAIKAEALAIGVGIVTEKTIDEINIYEASKVAMLDALAQLEVQPEAVLVDAMPLIYKETAVLSLIKGDQKSISIAAASIVAKVVRDQMMTDYAVTYPGYDFEHNFGYGTAKHLAGLESLGACPIHRLTFSPVKKVLR